MHDLKLHPRLHEARNEALGPVNSASAWTKLYTPTRTPSVGDQFWADRDLRWDGDLPYVGRNGNTARP